MTILHFEIDSNKSIEDIAVSLALSASAVFHERFPEDDQQLEWREAMTTLVRVLNEHVRTSDLSAEVSLGELPQP